MSIPADGQPQVNFDCVLAAPPEKVWRALTVPAYLDRWLMPVSQTAGGSTAFSGEDRGDPERVLTSIVAAEPPHRLQWSWRERGAGALGDGLVTFTLTPTEQGGTHLTVEQRLVTADLPQPANSNATMMLAA